MKAMTMLFEERTTRPTSGQPRASCWVAVLGSFILAGSNAHALSPLDSVHVSPDITVELTDGIYADEDVAIDDFVGTWPSAMGSLPHTSDIDGYFLRTNTDWLLSFDTTVDLGGGVVAAPEDVVRFNKGNPSIFVDGSAWGIPAGINVDAVAGDFPRVIVSFDTTVEIDGNIYQDEDLASFNFTSFSPFFDGSSAGIPSELDVDGAHVLEDSGNLLISFTTSGVVGGVSFDDEDILEYDGVSWEMAYDGSAEHAGWAPGDIDAVYAVPEPGQPLALAAGIVALCVLRRARV
jgi:hypothetical protein